MTSPANNRMPGIWQGMTWALNSPATGGGVSRPRLIWRTFRALLLHPVALKRWMSVAFELKSRGVIDDLPAEFLRAARPHVNRATHTTERVVQLIDHADWFETAFKHGAFEQITSGRPLVLLELPAPRGYDYLRLQLQRAPVHSPEGELLLTLTLQRSADVQKSPPVDVAAIGFSRFRIEGQPCLVVGGVRGQRHPVLRLSPVEITQALQGWKPPVLMIRVMQELARFWGLHLVGLDPALHQLNGWTFKFRGRYREAAANLATSYNAIWQHFDGVRGPHGWIVVPLNSDEKLEATALSPEKRSRQTRRADYWIRTRNQLRAQLRVLLSRPDREARLSRVTESLTMNGELDGEDDVDFLNSEDMVPSRVLETGPGSLLEPLPGRRSAANAANSQLRMASSSV